MSYMTTHAAFASAGASAGGIQELSFDEVQAVGGGDAKGAAQGAVLAGGALTVIGAAARTAALVPSPFSLPLAAFGTVTGLIGAGLAFAGGVSLAGQSPRQENVKTK